MTAGVDGTVKLTTLSVDSNGYGKKSGISIPTSVANGVYDDSAICVTDAGAYDGNQAPIYIY